MKWKLYKTIIGTISTTVPNNFSELHIVVSNLSFGSRYAYTIPKESLSNDIVYYTAGGYWASDNYHGCYLGVSLNKVKLTSLVGSLKDFTNEATISIYYR